VIPSERTETMDLQLHDAPHPADLFVTGMMRSGTTIANQICEISFGRPMLYQPCMASMVGAKRRFLESVGFGGEVYPIGPLFGETRPDQGDFARWLDRQGRRSENETAASGFALEQAAEWRRIAGLGDRDPVGAKEILCEEFARHFGEHGIHPIIVLRDPRDMICSAVGAGGRRFAGRIRPTLYMLHMWRRSAAFAIELQSSGLGSVVVYERLARSPWTEMNAIADASGGRVRVQVSQAEFMRRLESLGANSSHHRMSGVSTRSIGSYRTRLSRSVVEYVEAVCAPEMSLFGMNLDAVVRDPISTIRAFREPWAIGHPSVPSGYSTDPRLLDLEQRRIDRILDGGCPDEETGELFIRRAARDAVCSLESAYRPIPKAA